MIRTSELKERMGRTHSAEHNRGAPQISEERGQSQGFRKNLVSPDCPESSAARFALLPGLRVTAVAGLAFVALTWPLVSAAQEAAQPAGYAWAILEQDLLILFRILVVATVIERILEYLSLTWPYVRRGLRWILSRLRRPPRAHRPDSSPEVQKIRKQLVLQSIGILLGVAICWRAQLGIFAQLEGVASGRLGGVVAGWFVAQSGTWLDYIITGILVGLGTEPIHSIITTILRRKDLRRAKLGKAT